MKAGLDEAGRGPVVGPLVVGCVVVEDETVLRTLGVKDSKLVPPARRVRLAAEIRASVVRVETVEVSALQIDQLRQQKTLNEIEVDLFVELGRRVAAPEYYLDAADVDAERFGREFLRCLGQMPAPRVVSEHKADVTYPCVSAASIVAKVRRDEEIARIARRLEPKVDLPLGSGYSHDPVTRLFLKTYLERYGELPPEVRASWETAEVLVSSRWQRKLPGY